MGSALRVRTGEWEKGATSSYRWMVDGMPAARGTGTTYTVKKADAGSRITVRVTARKAGSMPVTKVSAALRIPRCPGRSCEIPPE